MAQHKSAKKRARQDLKRRARNRSIRSGLRSAVKSTHAAIAAGDPEQARVTLRATEGIIRRAASKGILPRTRASRTISRLSRAVHGLAGS